MERVSLFSIDRKEELASFSINRKECLSPLLKEERHSFLYIEDAWVYTLSIRMGGSPLSIERHSLSFYMKRRWCLTIRRATFVIQRRDSLFVVNKVALLSLYIETLSLAHSM